MVHETPKPREEAFITALEWKQSGNNLYQSSNFCDAADHYTAGYDVLKEFLTERKPRQLRESRDSEPQSDTVSYEVRDADELEECAAILLNNRAACAVHEENWDRVVEDCSESIKLHPKYVRAYVRRFRAYDHLEKWHEAVADISKATELDPRLLSELAADKKRVEQLSKEQFEKEKEEVIGKMKEFGNWALGKVGLSLDNFALEENEGGGYSVQYKSA